MLLHVDRHVNTCTGFKILFPACILILNLVHKIISSHTPSKSQIHNDRRLHTVSDKLFTISVLCLEFKQKEG